MSLDLSSISAQRIFEHIQKLTAIGPREDGTIADHQAMDYISSTLESLGLEARRQTIPCWVIEPISTSLNVIRPQLSDIKCSHGNLTGVTGPDGVRGELAFVDKAFERDITGKNLTGKVALAWQERYWEDGDQPRNKMMRAAECGAVGIIFVMKRRDDLITSWGLGAEPGPIPFLCVSYPDFLRFREMMQEGQVEVELKVIGEPRQGETANIWTVIPGTDLPDEMVGMSSSHHETVPICPGANDNASAIAVLLELARFFSERAQRRSILLISDASEEAGLWGAKAFVEENRDWLLESLKEMIVVDQIGGMEPLVFSGTTQWLEEMWVEEASKLGYQLTHCFDRKVITASDSIGDALPYFQAGIPTVFGCGWPTDFFYHTEKDTVDKICPNGIKAVTDFTASLLVRLASQE